MNEQYLNHARVVARILPAVAEDHNFALKGGTAINFFHRDLPRLSVDIDLTYLPLTDRKTTLQGIEHGLRVLAQRVQAILPNPKFIFNKLEETQTVYKLLIRAQGVDVKIEPNLILRGTLDEPEIRSLTPAAQKVLGLETQAIVLSHAELYAGKICAALDRQHARDLFDVKLLLDNEGITKDIRQALVIYLASGDRPIDELIAPKKRSLRQSYGPELAGMERISVSLTELEIAQEKLFTQIRSCLTQNERTFLLSLMRLEPQWNLMCFKNLETLPALRWKLMNIEKMTLSKRTIATQRLEKILLEQKQTLSY